MLDQSTFVYQYRSLTSQRRTGPVMMAFSLQNFHSVGVPPMLHSDGVLFLEISLLADTP